MLNWLMWKYDIQYRYEKFRDNLCLNIAHRLPKRLVMWCYIMVVAKSGEAPHSVNIDDLNRWGIK